MIIDNENQNKKVYQWINDYTKEGKLNIVTGYFTIGALAYISKKINKKINKFNLILGDIVNISEIKERPLDLLNENISIISALKLNKLAKEAVDFLRQNKVMTKTLEPNFCHAKVYIFEHIDNEPQYNYYITGSSNLTEKGMGLTKTNNVELNWAEYGSVHYNKYLEWFENLWNKPQAHKYKTIIDENGKKSKIIFKKYLINEIEKIFKKDYPRNYL